MPDAFCRLYPARSSEGKYLKRLEYSGYDNVGLALINSANQLAVYKTKGKVANLAKYVQGKDTEANVDQLLHAQRQ